MMNMLPERFKQFEAEALEILKKGVRELEFSGKTYQVQVFDPKAKESYWTFLQVDERGRMHDFFCECDQISEGGACAHLAAAYLRIYQGTHIPLHVRFERSLWHALFRLCADRFGDMPENIVRKAKGHYLIRGEGKAILLDLQAQGEEAVDRLHVIVEERLPETEETSLKFTNLSQEEINLWKSGRPSSDLRYELSLWNDLAKWFFLNQDTGKSYSIDFDYDQRRLPCGLQARFSDIQISLFVGAEDLPLLIPAFATVHAPLSVQEEGGEVLESIIYHAKFGALELIPKHVAKETAVAESVKGIEVGEWLFVPEKGFHLIKPQEEIAAGMLSGHEIDHFLTKERALAQRLIQDAVIYEEPREVSYKLTFTPDWHLHIQAYLQTPGDLSAPLSRIFGHWAYVDPGQFYEIRGLEFADIETVIAPQDMPSFIQQRRSWLNNQEGFHCRLASVEAQLTYQVSPEGVLVFGGKTHFENGALVHDFGPWVYVTGQGFFSKTSRSLAIPTRPGSHILPDQIPAFIRTHREELRQVPHFFSETSPIVKAYVSIALDADHQIICQPIYERDLRYAKRTIKQFDEIAFVEGEGFHELPIEARLPDRFRQEVIMEPEALLGFLTNELPKFHPGMFRIDLCLTLPKEIRLIAASFTEVDGRYLLKMHLQTNLGEVPLEEVWYALKQKKRYLFTPAGFLSLEDKQFDWLKSIPKDRVDRKKNSIQLTTLDLIKLDAWEGIEFQIKGEEGENARALMRELAHFRTIDAPDIQGLTSNLRPYQMAGVNWLWFLYRHGLSGLLCDDMGLGKTHQTMALIAAIRNSLHQDRSRKVLVVCPTSVIYHWQEKLQTFLPHLRVHVFIGTDRDLVDFHDHADILLTSYGIHRNEIELLSQISFEIAVFDEIQVAKNHLSRIHHSLLQIQAKMKLGLTGTPIENYLRELKSLFDIILPGYMPSEHDYREVFVKPIEKGNDLKRKSLLRRLIKPFVLRRRKEDVLEDLPEKTQEISHCDLLPKQRKLYNEVLIGRRQKILEDLKDEKSPLPFIHIFALLSHLKQICDHPALYAKDVENYKQYESGKWNLYLELLSEARDSQQKVVIFSQFLGMLDIIEANLKEQGIGYATIRGSTTNRGEQLERFNKDPHCEVFVASLQAAGLGVDLTAASVVIHYDRWWNAARENQATDRVHRIGQTRGVQVFKLVTKDSFEERIDALIEKKATLLDEIVGVDEQQVLKIFDRRELISLLQEVR